MGRRLQSQGCPSLSNKQEPTEVLTYEQLDGRSPSDNIRDPQGDWKGQTIKIAR